MAKNTLVDTFEYSDWSDSSQLTSITCPVVVPSGLSGTLGVIVTVHLSSGPFSGDSPDITGATFDASSMGVLVDAANGSAPRGAAAFKYTGFAADDTYDVVITFDELNKRVDIASVFVALFEDVDTGGFDVGTAIAANSNAATKSAVEGNIIYASIMCDDDGLGSQGALTNSTGQSTLEDQPPSVYSNYATSRITARAVASTGDHTETFATGQSATLSTSLLIEIEQEGAGGDPPQGTTTLTSITPHPFSIDITPSYTDSDQDGFEIQIDGGSWVDIGTTSPYTITGLEEETEYSIRARPYNTYGNGSESTAYDVPTIPVVSAAVLTRTATEVSVRFILNHDDFISTSSIIGTIVPNGDTPTRTQIANGTDSGDQFGIAYYVLGSPTVGNIDVDVDDWVDCESSVPISGYLDSETQYTLAYSVYDAGDSTVTIARYLTIPAFSVSPILSRPFIMNITSVGGDPSVNLGRWVLESGLSSAPPVPTSDYLDEYLPATFSGNVYMVIVPDTTGEMVDWPDAEQIVAGTDAADDPAIVVQSKTATWSGPLYSLGDVTAQYFPIVYFDSVTELDTEVNYVACFAQNVTGQLSDPVYFQFTTLDIFGINESAALSVSADAIISKSSSSSESLSISESLSVLSEANVDIGETSSSNEENDGIIDAEADSSESSSIGDASDVSIDTGSDISESSSSGEASDVTAGRSSGVDESAAIDEIHDAGADAGSSISESSSSDTLQAAMSSGVADSTESASILEDIDADNAVPSSISESSALSEETDVLSDLLSDISESSAVSDIIDGSGELGSTVSESASLADNSEALFDNESSVSESSSPGDVSDITKSSSPSISEASSLSESASTDNTIDGESVESLSLSEQAESSALYESAIEESIAGAVIQSSITSVDGGVAESVTISDLYDVLSVLTADASESMAISVIQRIVGEYYPGAKSAKAMRRTHIVKPINNRIRRL